MLKNILDLSYEELEEIVLSYGEKKYRTKQLYEGLYYGKTLDEISNISNQLRLKLKENFFDNGIEIYKKLKSSDGTIKYLYKLYDGNIIEGVLLSYKHGYTLCVSTQVGCNMKCDFCASGIEGLIRNLTSGEILGQILVVNKDISNDNKRNITNVVLMGSGEPLDNYDEVAKFLKLVNCEKGINISQRNISISTCGIIPKIIKLADDDFSVTLTISLHASNNEARNKIMPVNKTYKLEEVIKAAKYYFEKTKRRIVFEYALIKGVNDSFKNADELLAILKGFSFHLNLIPLNEVKEKRLSATDKKSIYAFCDYLTSKGMSATVRRTMGEDIEGACGQLRAKFVGDLPPVFSAKKTQ